jgi:5-methylcytosine-specific restriction endonuclease McrA
VTERSPRIRIPFNHFLRIAERDKWTCRVCGVGYIAENPWVIDHVKPLARGGTNHVGNLALCHAGCNNDKGSLVYAS